MMKGVFELYNLPVGERVEKGEARISTFEYKNENDILHNLRSIRNDGGLTIMEDGQYVRLHVGGELVMSDTRMEKVSNEEFCYKANGRVLVAGLGLGLILDNIKANMASGHVQWVTIIEKSKDVIDLVSPHFKHLPIDIIHADIFEWKPEKGRKFDVIYFDIWPRISTENLVEIKKLHNRFKFYLNRNNPKAWMNSWMKEWLQSEKRKYG